MNGAATAPRTLTPRTLTLSVPKATGTAGDTLVAWGLAIFTSEVLSGARVVLSDAGEHFLIETPVSLQAVETRLAAFSWEERLSRSRLLWLASTEKGRLPKSEAPFRWIDRTDVWVDRDVLREAHRTWRADKPAMQMPAGGDAPAVTTGKEPQLYSFYEVLTNPGKQWVGYNSFVERLYASLTPDGVNAILASYSTPEPGWESGSIANTKHPRVAPLNPPGFLYPGMNKGPTMRLADGRGATVGSASTPDWNMADRGDRSLFEVFLAYVGYFQVARIVTTKEQRIIAVPIPARVQVPKILGHLPGRELEATNLADYLVAQSALEYGTAALQYLAELQGENASELERRGMALSAAHLSVFWRPNGNVFAPSRLTQVSLPVWLPALRARDLTLAKDTLREHQARLKAVRGRWRDENKFSPEQRWALEAYLRSIRGGLRDWFLAVAAWFPAVRAAATRDWRIKPWSEDEIWRIATAMSDEQQPILKVLNHPAFAHLASAIRLSTVVPHLSRQRRKQGQPGNDYPFDPHYDLPSSLQSAAERGPEDFLREFYSFAGRYNDETARPNKGGRRPFLRDDDLAQLATWMHDRELRAILPYALLAFGTSLKGKSTGAGDVNAPPDPGEDGDGEEDAGDEE
jgi:hypothetical protein